MSRIDEQTDGIATSISSVALMSEIGMQNRASKIMLLRDRGCVRTLRPLFVYATVVSLFLFYSFVGIVTVNASVKCWAKRLPNMLPRHLVRLCTFAFFHFNP